MTLLPRWINKQVAAWASYDFADQAFQALFITLLFPIFLVQLGGNELMVGLIGGGSTLLAALLVPFIGAASDATGRRLPILFWTALTTAILVVLVGWVSLWWVVILAFLAKVTHSISKDVYDAKMIDVAKPQHYGSLSGLGNAFGYAGTIASVGAAAIVFSLFGWETHSAMSATFILIAIWYLIFLIPILTLVPDRPYQLPRPIKPALWQAKQAVIDTFRHLPQTQPLGRFLAAVFFYSNALVAIVFFLGLFSQQIVGLTLAQFFPVYALMALASGLGALVAGWLGDRLGPIKVIRACLLVWLILFAILLVDLNLTVFMIVGAVGGLFFGAIWTMNRQMIARITPAKDMAQIFGFEGLTSRFSGVLGPIAFGAAAFWQEPIFKAVFPANWPTWPLIHDYTLGLIILMALLLIGLYILRRL